MKNESLIEQIMRTWHSQSIFPKPIFAPNCISIESPVMYLHQEPRSMVPFGKPKIPTFGTFQLTSNVIAKVHWIRTTNTWATISCWNMPIFIPHVTVTFVHTITYHNYSCVYRVANISFYGWSLSYLTNLPRQASSTYENHYSYIEGEKDILP